VVFGAYNKCYGKVLASSPFSELESIYVVLVMAVLSDLNGFKK
jgi:hypothetical protein